MAKRRPSGEGMIRQKKKGQWEGRIVVGHKENGDPIFRYVYAKTQKELIDKLHHTSQSRWILRTVPPRTRHGDAPR